MYNSIQVKIFFPAKRGVMDYYINEIIEQVKNTVDLLARSL